MYINMTLGRNIQVGQRIRTVNGWRKVNRIDVEGAIVKEGLILFGDKIWGWKSK